MDDEIFYLEGYQAWQLGMQENENPYEVGTEKHEDWKGGYNDAAMELGEEE
ncbi:MAG: hypothetical protein AAFX78_02735 [Cyanobacteria bacterium J06638_20]